MSWVQILVEVKFFTFAKLYFHNRASSSLQFYWPVGKLQGTAACICNWTFSMMLRCGIVALGHWASSI